MTPVDPLLTANEVAAILRVSRVTLYREIRRGNVPAPIKLGTCSRWPRSEILEAIRVAGERRSD